MGNETDRASIEIPATNLNVRACRDGEEPCIVCQKPIKTDGHKLWLWIHGGGRLAVTVDEGKRLNASSASVGGDLGSYPVGRCCLKKFPELKPFLLKDLVG